MSSESRFTVAPFSIAPARRGASGRPASPATAVALAALAALAASATILPFAARADDVVAAGTLVLPALANTAETDRVLLREIDDAHVFVPEPAAAATGPTSATGATSDETVAVSVHPLGPTVQESVPEVPGRAAEDPWSDPVALLGTQGPADVAVQALSDDASPAQGPRADTGTADGVDAVADGVDDVWTRIRLSRRLPESRDREPVEALRAEYLAEGPWVTRILERGLPFIEHLVDALDRRFMPLGLAVLPAVESGFRPDVHSSGNAAGLWQIVPITAREIGLERSVWFDGRADTVASTRAALDYLSYLNAEFHGDWELTLAAYNAGPGRVRGAIRRNERADLPTDFWSLKLPPETRRYVPKVLALVSLLREEPSAIELPAVNGHGFERVDVGLRISIDRAAALSGIPEDELRRLNAHLVHGVTAPQGPHALYLPLGTAERFAAEIRGADGASLYSLPRTHEVVAGDTVSGIAYRYGMSQAQLMELNALSGTRVRIGQELAVLDVRRSGVVDVEYVVGAGDTLSAIAQSHAVGVGDISRADGSALDGDLIHPGETLTIVVGSPDAAG